MPCHLTLIERMDRGEITSIGTLVRALNVVQAPEEQQELLKGMQVGLDWFEVRVVGALTREDMQEYRSLANIEADIEEKVKLLRTCFSNQCNKIEGEYKMGEEHLIEVLQYTLQNLDGRIFQGSTVAFFHLVNKLFQKLDPKRTVFDKNNYPTHCSTLCSLHNALILVRLIVPNQLDPTQEEGLYSHFRVLIEAIFESIDYYPIRYRILFIQQSLQRLARPQARLHNNLKRAGQALKGSIYLYQVARGLVDLDFALDTFLEGCGSLKEAFIQWRIKSEAWYDWHQA